MKATAIVLASVAVTSLAAIFAAQITYPPSVYYAGQNITIDPDKRISAQMQTPWAGASLQSPATLDGSPIVSNATLATALATYLTTSSAASTYATTAQATYTGTGCISVSGARVISSSCASPPLTGTTGSIGGGLLIVGGCASGTATVAGATVGMAVIATPRTFPGGAAQWQAYISAPNTVTVQLCALVALTPPASVYDVRVFA